MAALGGGVALVVGAEQQPLLALVPVEVLLLALRSCRGVRGVEGGHGPALRTHGLAGGDVAAVPRPPLNTDHGHDGCAQVDPSHRHRPCYHCPLYPTSRLPPAEVDVHDGRGAHPGEDVAPEHLHADFTLI